MNHLKRTRLDDFYRNRLGHNYFGHCLHIAPILDYPGVSVEPTLTKRNAQPTTLPPLCWAHLL
jgi:hypothetical protein